MARAPNVRIPGEAPNLGEIEAEPEAREAPASAMQDDPEPTPSRTKRQAEAGGLPDAADIDAASIRKAVLTKQGWVCPLPENDATALSPAARR